MENNYSILHQLRDLTLSLALAFLLLLMFYSISHIIVPLPKFEDFPCEFNNKHCREWGKILAERQETLKELSLKADKAPQVSKQLQNQIDHLKSETKDLETKLSKTREARDALLNQANDQSRTKHWYIAIAMVIIALLAGFFIRILPLQIGSILGALFILSSNILSSGLLISNWFKLIGLLIALSLIIAISLKFYKKNM